MTRLLTYTAYGRIRHATPYVYELARGKNTLLILGSSHSNSLKHPQFAAFKKKFMAFKPDVLFVEGGWERQESKNEREALRQGEMAWLCYLAKKYNIPVLGWEPDSNAELDLLEKKFSCEELFAFFVLRAVPQYFRLRSQQRFFEEVIERFAKRTSWRSKWEKFVYSWEHLECIYQKLFGVPLNLSMLTSDLCAPCNYRQKSVLNEIAAVTSRFRDCSCISTITESFRRYRRVLAIMGSTHAVMQEPAYRAFFKKL